MEEVTEEFVERVEEIETVELKGEVKCQRYGAKSGSKGKKVK